MSDSIIICRGVIAILEKELESLRSMKAPETYIGDVLIGAESSDIKRFVHWIRQKEIRIRESWPMGETPEFPCWCVIAQTGGEKPDRYAIGDRIWPSEVVTVQSDVNGNPTRADRIDTFGVDWDNHLSLESWSLNGELTPLLHALAKHLIFRNKDEFAQFSIHEISLNEENFIPNLEIFPNIPYVRSLAIRLDGQWDYTVRTANVKLKNKTTFRLGGFSN